MVTLKHSDLINEYIGKSSDFKPLIGVPNGSSFTEMDGSASYFFSEEDHAWFSSNGDEPLVVAVTDITAEKDNEDIVITASGTNLGNGAKYIWTLKYDLEEPIQITSMNQSVALIDADAEAYEAAGNVSIYVTVEGYESDAYVLKEETLVANITAEKSDDDIIVTAIGMVLSEEDTYTWTLTFDSEEPVTKTSTGNVLTLTGEDVMNYDSAVTVTASVAVNEYESDTYYLKGNSENEPEDGE